MEDKCVIQVGYSTHKRIVDQKDYEIRQLTDQIEYMGQQIMKKDFIIKELEKNNKEYKVIHKYDEQGDYIGFYCPNCKTFHVFTGCRCCANKINFCYNCGASLDTEEHTND